MGTPRLDVSASSVIGYTQGATPRWPRERPTRTEVEGDGSPNALVEMRMA